MSSARSLRRHLAGDGLGGDAGIAEGGCDRLGVLDRGAEDDGATVAGAFLPVLDHGLVEDRRFSTLSACRMSKSPADASMPASSSPTPSRW